MRVFVYFNLHKKCFSVKALEGSRKGRVIAHRDSLALYGATFKVSQAGRERVLRERKKNVHAGVVGLWSERKMVVDDLLVSTGIAIGRQITYNPYKYDSFVYRDNEQPVKTKQRAVALDHGRIYTL